MKTKKKTKTQVLLEMKKYFTEMRDTCDQMLNYIDNALRGRNI